MRCPLLTDYNGELDDFLKEGVAFITICARLGPVAARVSARALQLFSQVISNAPTGMHQHTALLPRSGSMYLVHRFIWCTDDMLPFSSDESVSTYWLTHNSSHVQFLLYVQ